MTYKTYEWNRALPANTSKVDHYRTLEQLILSITKDIKTDITCTCCSSFTPVTMFFENFNRNKNPMPSTGRFLWGSEANISFYVDPAAKLRTMTFEADEKTIAVIKDTWKG